LNKIVVSALGVIFSSFVLAQNSPTMATPPVQRNVHGQTIVSEELPAAELTFSNDFRYIGGQSVNLYGNAEAEQHLFVAAGRGDAVQRFYWLPFEHFLPSNNRTYDYEPTRTTDIGGLTFIYDVKSFSNYAALETADSRSDGAAISKLLAHRHLVFPKTAVRVRLFYLPTPDRRTELMIIYGESLPKGSEIPAVDDGLQLDAVAPEAAKEILSHARKGLTIRKRNGSPRSGTLAKHGFVGNLAERETAPSGEAW
jgi:hypothetical protein